MKKTTLVLAFFVMAIVAKSQYSQWIYGSSNTSNTEEFRSGKVLRYTDPGHIMAGVAIEGNYYCLYVVKNDLNGNSTTTPYFNKRILLKNVGTSSPATVLNAKVTELLDGSGYAVAGITVNSLGQKALFYLKLNTTGAVTVGPVMYDFSSSVTQMEIGNIVTDNSGNYLYIVGGLTRTSTVEQYHYFVHKIDLAGTISWSQSYVIHPSFYNSNSIAYDAVEDNTGTELAVIGTLHAERSSLDGFFANLDAATGTPTAYIVGAYGEMDIDDELFSITYSNSDPSGNSRYLVAGRSKSRDKSNYDTWVMLLDNIGSVIWSTLTDIDSANLDDGAGGIIERLNTSGVLEYYAAGTASNGTDLDAYMQKGEVATGNVLMTYAYGDAGPDIAYDIDFNNSGTGDGIALFGKSKINTSWGPNYKAYFVKTYFNGVVGCYSNEHTFDMVEMLERREGYDMSPRFTFTQSALDYEEVEYEEYNICLDITLPTGSNDRLAPKNEYINEYNVNGITDGSGMVIIPNPAQRGAEKLYVDISEPATSGTLSLTITDMLGRQYINQTYTVQQNSPQQLEIDLAGRSLAPGLYIVKLEGTKNLICARLIVK